MLLPELRAPASEHLTSTTVRGATGNVFVVVVIVSLHSAFSPVQLAALRKIFQLNAQNHPLHFSDDWTP